MVLFEIPLLVSSDVNAGATNVSSDGSLFEVNLEEPVIIPSESTNCDLIVTSASVWNVIPNILTGVNDKFYIEISGAPFIATVPQGLYDLSTLEQAYERDLENQGAAAGTFSFLPDDPTQKVVIRINTAGIEIDFTQADTARDILGFNSQLLPPGGPSAGVESFVADNEAAFNNISFFLIHSDLCSEGIRVNNDFNQSIVKVDIGDTSPGSQIVQQYFRPVSCPCEYLIGSMRKSFRVWLTDQSNNRVNTQGETFNAQIIIRFRLPDID